jgi:flagellar biosynthesis protein FlhB
MADDTGDKTEAPTPRRRTEAREQGNIARSQDLTLALILIGILLMLRQLGPKLVDAMKILVHDMLGPASMSNLTTGSAATDTLRAVYVMGSAMIPLLAGVVLIAVVGNVAQVGLFFSTKRLQPNLGALNPMRGIGRMFSVRNSVQLLIGMVKLVMLSAVAYSAVHAHIEEIMGVQALTFTQIFGLGTTVVYTIALRVGIAMLVLAIIEYLYQRWRIEKELKMSKQEVKEEMRRMEGDPKIKQRRRQIAVQQLKKRLKKDVPTADVVVTNPTEFAIALKYDAGTMHAPRVVAKGQGLIAQHIREIAIAAGVPILERKPLARALYKLVEVGQEIPEEFYSAVAEILAYVYELSGKMRQPGTAFEAVAAR